MSEEDTQAENLPPAAVVSPRLRPALLTPEQRRESVKRQRAERKRERAAEAQRQKRRRQVMALEGGALQDTQQVEQAMVRSQEQALNDSGLEKEVVRRGPYKNFAKEGWLRTIHQCCVRIGSVRAGVAHLRKWEFCGRRPLASLSPSTVRHWYADEKDLVLKPHYAKLCEEGADPSQVSAGEAPPSRTSGGGHGPVTPLSDRDCDPGHPQPPSPNPLREICHVGNTPSQPSPLSSPILSRPPPPS